MRLRARRGALAALLAFVLVLAWFLFWPEPPAGSPDDWLRDAGLEARYETVDSLRIRYVRAGSGPTVVLIHGIGASIYSWRQVIPALATSFDVVALDLPGFGGSDRPADISAQKLPEIVLGLMDGLGLRRASLVGHSLGGAVATMLAADHSERVDHLVLVDSAGFNFAPEDRPALLRLVGSPLGAVLVRLPVRRRLVRIALRQVFHDDSLVTPARVDAYYAPFARPGVATSMRALLASDLAERIPFAQIATRVRAPTLVIWGDHDAWVGLRDADRFVAAIPGTRKVVFADSGHMVPEERPRELATVVRAFLTSR